MGKSPLPFLRVLEAGGVHPSEYHAGWILCRAQTPGMLGSLGRRRSLLMSLAHPSSIFLPRSTAGHIRGLLFFQAVQVHLHAWGWGSGGLFRWYISRLEGCFMFIWSSRYGYPVAVSWYLRVTYAPKWHVLSWQKELNRVGSLQLLFSSRSHPNFLFVLWNPFNREHAG